MALVGKDLANTIPASTTSAQALLMFDLMQSSLNAADDTVNNYSPLADALTIDGGSLAAAREYLATTRDAVVKYRVNFDGADAPITAQQLQQLRFCAAESSKACQLIDELFSTPYLSELSTSIVGAAGSIVGKVGDAVSKVAGSFVGATWWIWVVVVGVGAWLWFRRRSA